MNAGNSLKTYKEPKRPRGKMHYTVNAQKSSLTLSHSIEQLNQPETEMKPSQSRTRFTRVESPRLIKSPMHKNVSHGVEKIIKMYPDWSPAQVERNGSKDRLNSDPSGVTLISALHTLNAKPNN